MERLTLKRRLPPKGLFMEVSKSELNQVRDVSQEDIYRKLQAYEDTELTPSEILELQQENKELKAFKDYFHELHGKGLEVVNWHLNGATKPFDDFYDGAVDEMRRDKQ